MTTVPQDQGQPSEIQRIEEVEQEINAVVS
jgi:hypothetical protein